VAQNVGGEVSLTIDGKEVFRHTDPDPLEGDGHGMNGKEVFRHTDPDPLEGDGHGMIGLFTWAGKMTVSNLRIFSRTGESSSQPATQPVDEKAVAALIRQLGDNDFKTREAATQALIAVGRGTIPMLAAKAQEKDLDPEVANRIQVVLKKLRASR
jgi:hypothetical protein